MQHSAGLVLFRRDAGLEVLIAHPGGPLWARRERGAWSILKGELDPEDDPLAAALREFTEETGLPAPPGPYLSLGRVTQKGGKVVEAWAVEGDLDPEAIRPGTFTMEWPPGFTADFPEIDRVMWVDADTARDKLNPAQVTFVDALLERIGDGDG
ncbi:MAG: NUDIX domain-containing protein [Acidimicrobiia bacterium]